jgi:hypothetical protein
MRKCACTLLSLLWSAVPVLAQQCSKGTITPGAQTINVPCLLSAHYQTQTVTGTNTVNDQCLDTNNNVTYMNVNSKVTGYGQCTAAASNPPCGGKGQPACTYQVYQCPPIYNTQVTQATSSTDYNRFYNRAFTNTINGNSSVPTCNGQGTAYNQDFQQCQGVAVVAVARTGAVAYRENRTTALEMKSAIPAPASASRDHPSSLIPPATAFT